jgi:hypothetical protein
VELVERLSGGYPVLIVGSIQKFEDATAQCLCGGDQYRPLWVVIQKFLLDLFTDLGYCLQDVEVSSFGLS